jgi:flagellar motor protein MotB
LFIWLILGIAESSKEIQPVKIRLDDVSDVGPFPKGEDCLTNIVEDRIIDDVKRSITLSEGKSWSLLLVGSADIRPLGTKLQQSLGNNVGLANARAKCVRRLLLERLGADIDKERIVIFPDAPTYIGPSVGDAEMAKDRRVKIFFIKTVEETTK